MNNESLQAEYNALCELPRQNIGMGDYVLFPDDNNIITAGKVVGICPYYSLFSLEPPGYYFEIETAAGVTYEIDEDAEIEKRITETVEAGNGV